MKIEQQDLSSRAGISIATLRRMEGADGPLRGSYKNVNAVVAALEAAGVEFIPENGGGPGVRLNKRDDAEAGIVADQVAALVHAGDPEAAAKANQVVHAYLASLRPKPKDFRGARLHLLQLFWERVPPSEIADKVASAFEEL